MSDLDKVYAYANKFCKNKVMQLRWEGAGDCEHPAVLLGVLKNKVYQGTTNKIQFQAVLNLYEADDSVISDKAYDRIVEALEGATDQQTFKMWCNVDVTRTSRSIAEQPVADVMFVRNIMLTSGSDSQTTAETPLKNLHVATIRNRSNSIIDGGQLRLGMSGLPGLIGTTKRKREGAQVQRLFIGAQDMFAAADESGLEHTDGRSRGRQDMDRSVEVMKNDGSSLGYKQTYYLTFMK